MRFKIAQLDTSSTNARGVEKIEGELNGLVEKIEKSGNVILGEHFMPQKNAIRSLLILEYEKAKELLKGEEAIGPARYTYQILDSRNGYGIVDRLLNEKVIALEKAGRKVIRSQLIPMMNDAFVQMLLVHVSSGKEVEKVVEKKKPIFINDKNEVEVKDDGKRPSEAITA